MTDVYEQADLDLLAVCEQVKMRAEGAIPHFEKNFQIPEDERAIFEEIRAAVGTTQEIVNGLVDKYGSLDKNTEARDVGGFQEYCSFMANLYNRATSMAALKSQYEVLATRLQNREESAPQEDPSPEDGQSS